MSDDNRKRHHQTMTEQSEDMCGKGGDVCSGDEQQPSTPNSTQKTTTGGPSCSKLRKKVTAGGGGGSSSPKTTASANEQFLEKELANYWSGLKRVRHELEKERKELDEKEHLIKQIYGRLKGLSASEGQKEKEQLKLLRQDWLMLTLKTKVCVKVMMSNGAASPEQKFEQARALFEANLEEEDDFEKPCELVSTAVEAKLRELAKSQGITVRGPIGMKYFLNFLSDFHGPEGLELFSTGCTFARMAQEDNVYDREEMGWVLKHVGVLLERIDQMIAAAAKDDETVPRFRLDEFKKACAASLIGGYFEFASKDK